MIRTKQTVWRITDRIRDYHNKLTKKLKKKMREDEKSVTIEDQTISINELGEKTVAVASWRHQTWSDSMFDDYINYCIDKI